MLQAVRKLFSNELDAPSIVRNGMLKHTPDAFFLQQRSSWNVFLYCDKQDVHSRGLDVGDMKWWGFTKNHYTMWKNDLGKLSHPVAFDHCSLLDYVPHSKIKGQYWNIPTDRLIKLDEERQNGVQFHRVRVPITIPHMIKVEDKDRWVREHQKGKPYIKGDQQYHPAEVTAWAWMYVGVPEFWLEGTLRCMTVNVMRRKDGRVEQEVIRKLGTSGVYFHTCKLYLTNNENNDPYYFFSPFETTSGV